MEIQSAFNAGLQGFQRASVGVTDATVNINRQTRPSSPPVPSVEQSLVQLTSESRMAQANVRSIQAADEALGTIIDVRV